MREIEGLGFENAPRVPVRSTPALPLIAPFVDHRYARSAMLDVPTVALSLYEVVNMATGEVHVTSRQALADRFRIPVNSTIVLSGVDKDAPIESWWALKNRPEILEKLFELGIGVVTSPNYSVLTDVPRTDNLHAMKRILLTWIEMAAAGLAAALHVNSRTEQDYQRWGDLIAERAEIQIIAFEFATGGGRGERIDWHVEQLSKLADRVGRGLALVIRGGGRKLPILRKHFAQVTLIETDAFYKAHRRRRAYLTEAGRLKWAKQLTPAGAAIDELLANNVAVVRAHFELGLEPELRLRSARRTANSNDETAQYGLLRYFDLASEAGGIAGDSHHMIATAKA